MGRTVSISGLANAITQELADYSREITEGLKREVREAAKECREEIMQNSPARTGDYRDGWQQKVAYESRDDLRIVVRNQKHSQLTHLLENGHALVYPGKDGTMVTKGRVAGKPHIRPAEQHAAEKLQQRAKVVVRG